jgi:hypothetical protein
MYFNGDPTPEASIPLVGAIGPHSAFVLVHMSARFRDRGNQTSDWSGWFNGDDAVLRRRDVVVLDVIGQVGVDPGAEWGRASVRTRNQTLRRKPTVVRGDSNGNDAFDPAGEWLGFPALDSTGLGSHFIEP